MLKKFGVVVSLLLAMVLLLSGCGPQAETGPEKREGPTLGGSITYGMTGDPVIFNPIPVSYTHLDVYKRQSKVCLLHTGWPRVVQVNTAKPIGRGILQ